MSDKPVKYKKRHSDNKDKNLAQWEYCNDNNSIWTKLSLDLLKSPQFNELSYAARLLYIVIIAHKHDTMQSQCLYNALDEFYKLTGIEKTKADLQYECGDYTKARRYATKFVFPAKQLEEYGFSPQYASKLKKELIDKGFIKVFANAKEKSRVDRAVTIYEFSDAWKAKHA